MRSLTFDRQRRRRKEGRRKKDLCEGLDLVQDHGLVGKLDDGLGEGECQGSQTRAKAANEDEGLHLAALFSFLLCWGLCFGFWVTQQAKNNRKHDKTMKNNQTQSNTMKNNQRQ